MPGVRVKVKVRVRVRARVKAEQSGSDVEWLTSNTFR